MQTMNSPDFAGSDVARLAARGRAASVAPPLMALEDVFITDELDRRPASQLDSRFEKRAILELAARMTDEPEVLLPRFVELAMALTDGVSAGLSLLEPTPAPGLFRWRYLRGAVAPLEGAAAARHFSPSGVVLDRRRPALLRHPERLYDWLGEADLVFPELLVIPLYADEDADAAGALWIVSDQSGHFHRDHVSSLQDLAHFVGTALQMVRTKGKLKQTIEAQALLAREMAHRVKNLLAVTESLVRVTARQASTPDDMAEAISERLHGLAAAHSLVARSVEELGFGSLHLEHLLRTILAAHDRADGMTRLQLDGPAIACGPKAADALALTIHELATNAAKYGALGAEGGLLRVSWAKEGDQLRLQWVERGGPPAGRPPRETGFGSLLIRNAVGQLHGAVAHDWRPEGLSITLILPLDRLAE